MQTGPSCRGVGRDPGTKCQSSFPHPEEQTFAQMGARLLQDQGLPEEGRLRRSFMGLRCLSRTPDKYGATFGACESSDGLGEPHPDIHTI